MERAIIFGAAEEERSKKALKNKRRCLRDNSRPMLLPDREFVNNFRLDKTTFESLCEELIPLMANTRRRSAINPVCKILAALNFFATGSYQRSIGNHYLGISQTSLSECLGEVTDALNSPQILEKYIKFPRTSSERENVTRRFMDTFGFPGVLGCIDGTHVAIIRPNLNEESYFNRKLYHSINVMVICNADLQIMHVDASFGGASHDSHVFNSSPVKLHMQNLQNNGQRYWLLGDSGYAQRPWMMTPILNAASESPEEHYTSCHIHTRNVVERCFGVLKSRFRCLLSHRVLHYTPLKAAKIINSCVVLHNMCNHLNINVDHEAMVHDNDLQPIITNSGNTSAVGTERQSLVERLWRCRRS